MLYLKHEEQTESSISNDLIFLKFKIVYSQTSNNMQKYEDFPVLPVLAFHCRVESAIMFCTGRH